MLNLYLDSSCIVKIRSGTRIVDEILDRAETGEIQIHMIFLALVINFVKKIKQSNEKHGIEPSRARLV